MTQKVTETNINDFTPDEGLYFVALGGVGVFGANLYLYGHKGKWLVVELGIGFADGQHPGVDILVADPAFLKAHRRDICGIVITHAHEDHIGGLARVWDYIGAECPVYGTAFALSVLKMKMAEAEINEQAIALKQMKFGDNYQIGPFSCRMIAVDHSIPEASALVIETSAGRVLHSGDWKLDPTPVIGSGTDEAAFRALGDGSLLALMGDSTNAHIPGESGSEKEVQESLIHLFGKLKNRILISCFSSNIARIESICRAAEATGRHVCLVGRSLWRMVDAAQINGYLADVPDFIEPDEADQFPRDKIVLICTGSQGERRAALWRIASEDHPAVSVTAGDHVIFSSRPIPGNEKDILEVQNLLIRLGINVIVDDDKTLTHVSGHAAIEEMRRFYQWTRPRALIPVHGEFAHLKAHAELARTCQIPQVHIPESGEVIRLDGERLESITHVPTGLLAEDGGILQPVNGTGPIAKRRRLMFEGAVVAHLVIDGKKGIIAPPRITSMGLTEDMTDMPAGIANLDQHLRTALGGLKPQQLEDNHAVDMAVRRVLRQAYRKGIGKRPLIEVEITRI